jgi:MFS family permease
VKPFLLAGLGAATIRWFSYGMLHDYRLALAFQLLHGLSFAGFYVAGVTYIDQQVPDHLRSTGQTLFYGATFGLGTVAGANVFGALFDRVHAQGIFLVASGVCAITVACIALYLPNTRVVPASASAEAS